MSENNNEENNKTEGLRCEIKIGLDQYCQIKYEIDNLADIDTNIDMILLYLDRIHLINHLSSQRIKFIDCFTVKHDKVEFNSSIVNWSEWEKIALILFTRHPFPTDRDYVWRNEITPKNLNSHLVQKSDYFKKYENNQIGISDEGYKYIINKLEKEKSKILDTNNPVQDSNTKK